MKNEDGAVLTPEAGGGNPTISLSIIFGDTLLGGRCGEPNGAESLSLGAAPLADLHGVLWAGLALIVHRVMSKVRLPSLPLLCPRQPGRLLHFCAMALREPFGLETQQPPTLVAPLLIAGRDDA